MDGGESPCTRCRLLVLSAVRRKTTDSVRRIVREFLLVITRAKDMAHVKLDYK